MSCVLSIPEGGHNYGKENSSTNDCLFKCGAWMGGSRSGAPDGIDPFGLCPENSLNKTDVLLASKLIGKKLDGFVIQMYTEVYRTDVDGRKEKTTGYFKNDSIARAFAGCQVDASYFKTQRVLLLTDGKIAYLLGNEVKLMDDEQAKLKVIQSARAKLSPGERELLGL